MTDDPPVEILMPTESEVAVAAGADHAGVHAWLRTAALIIGAGALVWGVSVAEGIREAERGQTCMAEIQLVTLSPRPGLSREQIGQRLADKATDCGLDLTADSIRQSYEGL